MAQNSNTDIEYELTFLAKEMPDEILDLEPEALIDVYVPNILNHPNIRIRKRGGKYEITKKTPIKDGDSSIQSEQTIALDEIEFETLSKSSSMKVSKMRYKSMINDIKVEVDVFQEGLKGLVLIDFEFENLEDKNKFNPPEFCLADVTQEVFIAGGMLAGKSYKDIEADLLRHNYKPLMLA